MYLISYQNTQNKQTWKFSIVSLPWNLITGRFLFYILDRIYGLENSWYVYKIKARILEYKYEMTSLNHKGIWKSKHLKTFLYWWLWKDLLFDLSHNQLSTAISMDTNKSYYYMNFIGIHNCFDFFTGW